MPDMSGRVAGYSATAIAWVLLAGSMFLPRADDYFYEVPANLLYQYQPVGAILIVALILLVPLTLLAARGSRGVGIAVLALWLIATVATVWAAFHRGSHPTDAGEYPNDIAAGTVFSVAAAVVGLAGALAANKPQHVRPRTKSA